jgi:hypothetical protein
MFTVWSSLARCASTWGAKFSNKWGTMSMRLSGQACRR